MKSIIQEASSISKAIEKGWIQAGKPQEFTIKIFEDATKNFLGIATKPAKIGIFFTEKVAPTHTKTKPARPQKEEYARPPHKQPRREEPRTPYPKVAHKAPVQPEFTQERKPEFQKDVWSPELVDFVSNWVHETLSFMGKPTNFTVEAKNYYLKISFAKHVLENEEKERFLFRNFAYLVMQALRNKFKKNFRGFKVILTTS